MQRGLLVPTVYWSILVLVLPASIIIDRWSRKKTISIMAVFWSIAAIVSDFVGNFSQPFTVRTFLGVGKAGYAAGGTAMLSRLYPAEKRARMMDLWNASIPLATAVGIAAGGVIAHTPRVASSVRPDSSPELDRGDTVLFHQGL